MKTFTFTDEATGFVTTVTVTENGDGTLSVTMDVDESTGITGDVRALYFNTTDDADYDLELVDDTGSDAGVAAIRDDVNKVRWVGSKDTNVNGEVIQENDGAFDAGFEFGTQGLGSDDVQHMEFTIAAGTGEALTIDSFDWGTLGLRVTSVGDVDGSRDGSLKLTGEETTPPEEPNSVVAEDDFGQVDGELMETVEALQDGLMVGNALLNDFDPEGDTFQIISVTGAGGTDATADADGWFGWVAGSLGGEIRLNEDGSFQFRDPGGVDFDAGYALIEPLTTSVSYEVMDEHGATDAANIYVTVFPNEGGGDFD